MNITTVEDPIEYQLSGITQAEVNVKADMTFAKALRAMLRQDPDIILVGEIRDTETAKIAVEAALTGHLVLGTIHANDSAATVTRLFHMGIEPFLVSSSLIGVLAQRLIRRICAECKEAYEPNPTSLERLGIRPVPGLKLYRGKGCDTCNGTGYKGRMGVHEFMMVNDAIRREIVSRGSAVGIKRIATEQGMSTLAKDGIRKVLEGKTTIEEALRVLIE